jgi:hypothetical protein
MASDFSVENHGSIILLRPLTDAAEEWIAGNLPEDRVTFGGATVIEPRYILAVIEGIMSDGLTFDGGVR